MLQWMSENFFGVQPQVQFDTTLLDLKLASFDTIIANNSDRFMQRWQFCDNKIVQHLLVLS